MTSILGLLCCIFVYLSNNVLYDYAQNIFKISDFGHLSKILFRPVILLMIFIYLFIYFADDTCIIYMNMKPKTLETNINHDLNKLTEWLRANRLSLYHHSFNVSVPLKMGRTAPMFVPSFFLHSILFVGSALDSFQCLRSSLIVSFHVFHIHAVHQLQIM